MGDDEPPDSPRNPNYPLTGGTRDSPVCPRMLEDYSHSLTPIGRQERWERGYMQNIRG